MSNQYIKIYFINVQGNGFADELEVAYGTTLGQLFDRRTENANPDNYKIRVNASTINDRAYVLQNGDRVSFTVSKMTGARG